MILLRLIPRTKTTTSLLLLLLLIVDCRYAAAGVMMEDEQGFEGSDSVLKPPPPLYFGSNPTLTYQPTSEIADYAIIDLDQRDIEIEVMKLTNTGFDAGERIYKLGGHSMIYTTITLFNPTSTRIAQGALLVGTNANGDTLFGTSKTDVPVGSTTVQFLYNTNNQINGRSVFCQGNTNNNVLDNEEEKNPSLDGCLHPYGMLTVQNLSIMPYKYNPKMDHGYGSSFIQFSHKLNDDNEDELKEDEEYAKLFYSYYHKKDYAHEWITAALEGRPTTFSKNGNQHFNHLSMYIRGEAVRIGTAYMSLWMYIIHKMEYAIETCSSKSWDEAVAYYTGSEEVNGNKGYLMFSLANEMCANFGTCGSSDNINGTTRTTGGGTAYVNIKIFEHFNAGQELLLSNNCSSSVELKHHKNRIVQLMTVPLIQATLQEQHGYRNNHDQGKAIAFAATVLPMVYNCSTSDAEIIYNEVTSSNATTTTTASFESVLAAFEKNYYCMGITCEEVGTIIEQDPDIPNSYTTSYCATKKGEGRGDQLPSPDDPQASDWDSASVSARQPVSIHGPGGVPFPITIIIFFVGMMLGLTVQRYCLLKYNNSNNSGEGKSLSTEDKDRMLKSTIRPQAELFAEFIALDLNRNGGYEHTNNALRARTRALVDRFDDLETIDLELTNSGRPCV